MSTDTPQPTVRPALFSAHPLDLPREERGIALSGKFESSGTAGREQRPNVAPSPDIAGGFDVHLAVYAIF